jgi:uncharacterized membrane protein
MVMKKTGTTYARVATLGFVAGLRSQMPLALLAVAASRGDIAEGVPMPMGWLRNRWIAAGLGLAAVGELIGDKLPITPSRLEPGSLAGRTVFGGLAGGVVARLDGRSTPVGFALGGVGAVAGSFGGYHARVWIGRRTGLPDAVVAVGEDVVALVLGCAVVGNDRLQNDRYGTIGSRAAPKATPVKR